MARLKTLDVSDGAKLFDRPSDQWRDLGAPDWVYETHAGHSAYVFWCAPGYGERLQPGDTSLRYYVQMLWWPYCVRPQFLWSVGALTETERNVLESERYRRWGRPGRCASPMLAVDAEGVPGWLECCRSAGRSRRG